MNVFPQGYFGKPMTSEAEARPMFDSLTSYKKKYLVPFIKNLPRNAQVLDAGCGKGKTIRLIRELRPDIKVMGCDITDVSVFLPKNIEFIQCSTDDISVHFKEQSFDAIICQHVIEHMVYSTTTIHSFYAVLKQGGKLFLETPNWTRLLVPFSPLYFWNDYTHIHPFNITGIRRLFNEYGFKEEYVRSVSTVDIGNRLKFFKKENIKSDFSNKKTDNEFIKKSLANKLFDAFLDITLHQVLRDVIVAVASKR